jgi:uncharacterized protein (TIRG00374 family)
LKNLLSLLAKICISVALLFFLFKRIDFTQTIFYIRTVEPRYFTYAVLLFLFVTYLGLVRWVVLLKIVKKDLSFGRILVSHCGGLFFNVFLPSTIGGDVARTVDLTVHTKDGSAVFATVLLDRLYGFLALVIISFAGYAYGYFFGLVRDFRLFLFILIFAVLIAGAFLVIFSKRAFNLASKIIIFKSLRDYLAKFHNCCYLFRFQKAAGVKAMILSLLIQGLFSVLVYFIGMSLGINLNFVYYFILIPIVSTISFLPISLGGLGLRENVAVTLFSPFVNAGDKVAAMSIMIFVLTSFIGIIGGVIYGIALHYRRLQRN